MEQTNLAPAKQDAANENQMAEKQATKVKAQTKVITTNFVTKSGINYSPSFILESFTQSLGKVLDEVNESFEVTLFGCKVYCPSLTVKNDKAVRTFAFLKNLALAIFKGYELDTPLPANEVDKITLLEGMRKKGYKFEKLDRKQVVKAIEIKANLKAAILRSEDQIVIKNHLQEISATKVFNTFAKELKAENLSALTGIEVKTRESFKLPAPKVTK